MKHIITIFLIIHVIAGTGALLSGAGAILLKKQTTRHKPIGKIYFWCMTFIFITGVFLSIVKGLLFLFFISIFTYYATITAYRALKFKNSGKPGIFDWGVEFFAALTFVGLIVMGFWYYFKFKTNEAIIPLAFGSLGVIGVYRNVRNFIKIPDERHFWLKKHIGNMLGSYIGAITAFVVNQSEHIPLNPILLWLGPTIVLMPVIIAETRKLDKKPIA